MQTIINIVVTVLVFGLLILSHELGHFIMAVWAKVKVHEFSIGMGPALFKREGKLCRYCIRALPIGGYVQMEGEDGGEGEGSFSSIPRWKRFLVLVMGAAMNIAMGFLLICCINATISAYPTTTVATFAEDSVSFKSGLQVDDRIIEIDGYNIYSYMDIPVALAQNGKDEIFDITVRRGGEKVLIKDVSFPKIQDPDYGEYIDTDFKVYGQRRSLLSVFQYSGGYTLSVMRSVYSFVGSLFTFTADLNQVSGPVGTASVIGESAVLGLDSLLLVVAIISINLGIMNLLPFPALDGGRILFLLIEAIRKKPMNPKVEAAINGVGLLLLLALMALVMVKDIVNLF